MGAVAPVVGTAFEIMGVVAGGMQVVEAVTGKSLFGEQPSMDPNMQTPHSRLSRGFREYAQSLEAVAPSYMQRYSRKVEDGYQRWSERTSEPYREPEPVRGSQSPRLPLHDNRDKGGG